MKTRMTIVAVLAAALCGCRAPSALSSAGDVAGHARSTDEASGVREGRPAAMMSSTARDASTRPAAMMQAGDPANSSNLPVPDLLARAEQAIRAQQFVVARDFLQSILVRQPKHPRAHHLLAVIADLEGRFGDAERHYFAALEGDPNNAQIVGDLGYSYYLQSRLQESERYLQRALEIDPHYVGAAKNLAQLYYDRQEVAHAEMLLRATLPAAEAEAALNQLGRQPHGEDPSLLSHRNRGGSPESTGTELARQIQEELDAAAREEVATGQPRRGGTLAAGQTMASAPVYAESQPGSMVSINPWSREPSADAAGTRTPPARISNGSAQGGAMTAMDSMPAINPIRSVGGQSHPGASNSVERAVGMEPAVATDSEPPARRWPPATWAPLMNAESSGSENPPLAQQSAVSQPPQYPRGGVRQASGSASPWDTDVRQLAGREGDSSVERAYFEEDPRRNAESVIEPVSMQSANSPAVLPEWETRISAQRPTAAPRSVPGTDSSRNGSQDPPAYRDLTRVPGRQSAATPTFNTPAPPLDSFQSVRQSSNSMMNAGVESSYARTPGTLTRSPMAGATANSYEVPAYPRGPAAGVAPSDSRAADTPWPSRTTTADDGSPEWTQQRPNTGTSSTTNSSSSSSRDGIVVPQPYRGRQTSSGYERYPASNQDW